MAGGWRALGFGVETPEALELCRVPLFPGQTFIIWERRGCDPWTASGVTPLEQSSEQRFSGQKKFYKEHASSGRL